MNDRVIKALSLTAFAVVLTFPAHAAGSGMPWEAPLQSILDSILTGLGLAFGESGGGMRKLLQIVFGLSIAFAATSFFLSFFSFGGGATL